jgi:hypothetical protein
MKKFIFSLITFSILIVSLFTLISMIVKTENIISNDYMAAMIDKHNRINQLDCPKIIFAGGSNLAFGLNSEEVENEFSIPVVNLGLHAGLGTNFILNELKSTIKNGDVVFLSIEYLLGADGDYKLKKNTSYNFKEARKYYTFDLRAEILIEIDKTRANIKSYKKNEKLDLNLKPEIEVYSREAFNKYGDVIAHLEKPSPKESNDRYVLTYSYWPAINKLNEFYNYAKSKNVEVFFIYPNFPVTDFKKNQEVINKLSMDLSNNLKIEILNRPSDLVFADSLFFDTVYHLNKKGRELRTKKLIELIKKSTSAQQWLYAMRVSEVIEH